MSNFHAQTQQFDIQFFLYRVLKCVLALTGFFVSVERRGLPFSSMLIFSAMLALFISPIWNKKASLILNHMTLQHKLVVSYALCVFAEIVMLYLTYFTHQAVMGPLYISMLFPVFATLPVLLLKYGYKGNKQVIAYLVLLLLASLVYSKPWKAYPLSDTGTLLANNSDFVLVDNAKRGILLVAMSHIADDTPVYVAMQRDLLAKQAWKSHIRKASTYFTVQEGGNTAANRDGIMTAMSEGGDANLFDR